MATVIDTLVLQLGLDPRQFVEGRREAEHALAQSRQSLDTYGKNIEAQGKKIGEVFGIVKAGAVGIVGAFVGGATAGWIDGIMRMDASAGRLSKTIGIGIPNLSLWQELVKQVGGDANEAGAALCGMRQMINDFLQGGAAMPIGASTLLDRIGGWQGKTPDQIMQQLVDHFDKEISSKRMRPDEAATFLRRLPGMTEGMIAVILKGRDAFDKMSDAAKKAGLATKESADQAQEYVKQEALLIQQFHDLGRMTFPGVTELIKTISEFVRAHGGEVKLGIVDAFRNLGDTVQMVYGWVEKLYKLLPQGLQTKAADFFSDEALEKRRAERSEWSKWFSDKFDELLGGKKPPAPGAGARPAGSVSGGLNPISPAAAATQPTGGAGGQGGYARKPGAGQTSLLTDTLAQRIQGGVPEVNRFTAFNDPYHAFLGGGSHPAGRALDFTIKDTAKSAEAAAQVREILRDMGLTGTVIDEYKRRSGNWTGGHIHVQIDPPTPAAARGLTGAGAGRPGAPAAAAASPENRTSNTKSEQHSSVNINTLNVNAPKATDADGIARDMGEAVKPLALAAQFNTGLV